MGSKSAGRS